MERRLVGGWWEVEGRIARAITVEAMMVKVKMTAVGGRVGRRWSVGRCGAANYAARCGGRRRRRGGLRPTARTKPLCEL